MLRFLPTLPNLHDLNPLPPNLITLAQLVVRPPSRHEVVRSNPCRCVTCLAENIPVLSGRLVDSVFQQLLVTRNPVGEIITYSVTF